MNEVRAEDLTIVKVVESLVTDTQLPRFYDVPKFADKDNLSAKVHEICEYLANLDNDRQSLADEVGPVDASDLQEAFDVLYNLQSKLNNVRGAGRAVVENTPTGITVAVAPEGMGGAASGGEGSGLRIFKYNLDVQTNYITGTDEIYLPSKSETDPAVEVDVDVTNSFASFKFTLRRYKDNCRDSGLKKFWFDEVSLVALTPQAGWYQGMAGSPDVGDIWTQFYPLLVDEDGSEIVNAGHAYMLDLKWEWRVTEGNLLKFRVTHSNVSGTDASKTFSVVGTAFVVSHGDPDDGTEVGNNW